MPFTAQILVLPRPIVITHMRKRGTICCFVITLIVSLNVIRIQTHCLPIIYCYFFVEARVACTCNNSFNFYTIVSICLACSNLFGTDGLCRIFVYFGIGNPILNRQGRGCHRAVRSLVLDHDRIQHIADYNLRRADLLAGEGDGGLINRRWCRFQRVGITLGATTAARHCPVSPGESNIIVGITTIPARDFKIEFACL